MEIMEMFNVYGRCAESVLGANGIRVDYRFLEKAVRKSTVVRSLGMRALWSRMHNIDGLVRELVEVRGLGLAKSKVFRVGPDEICPLEEVFRAYDVPLYDRASMFSVAESLVRETSESYLSSKYPSRMLFFNDKGYATLHNRGVKNVKA